MRQGTFALSQKELQRVAVISSCVKGALAHASRGRPSHRRLPQRVRDRILHLARTTYAGFNDHHLCEKLVEKEGFSLGRETLRRLLRSAGIGLPATISGRPYEVRGSMLVIKNKADLEKPLSRKKLNS